MNLDVAFFIVLSYDVVQFLPSASILGVEVAHVLPDQLLVEVLKLLIFLWFRFFLVVEAVEEVKLTMVFCEGHFCFFKTPLYLVLLRH